MILEARGRGQGFTCTAAHIDKKHQSGNAIESESWQPEPLREGNVLDEVVMLERSALRASESSSLTYCGPASREMSMKSTGMVGLGVVNIFDKYRVAVCCSVSQPPNLKRWCT